MKLHRGALFVVLSLFVAFGSAHADTPIVFHYDISAGASWGKVLNSSGETIAAYYHIGAAPSGYSGSGDEDVPTLVLAELRDDLAASSDDDADEAEAFVKSLMGSYANTPVGSIPWGHESTVVYEDHDIDEYCGDTVSGSACTDTWSVSAGTLCLEEACKKTRIAPLP